MAQGVQPVVQERSPGDEVGFSLKVNPVGVLGGFRCDLDEVDPPGGLHFHGRTQAELPHALPRERFDMRAAAPA